MKTKEERTVIEKLGDVYVVVVKPQNPHYERETILNGEYKTLKGAEKKRQQFLSFQ